MTSVDMVISSLDAEPAAWTEGEYTIAHRSGLSIWKGPSFLSLSIYTPVRQSPGLADKWRLSSAIQRWRTRKVHLSLRGDSKPPAEGEL